MFAAKRVLTWRFGGAVFALLALFIAADLVFSEPVISGTTASFEFGDGSSQPGSADILADAVQSGPDWSDLFDDSGYRLDRIGNNGRDGANFVADAVDLGGIDAALVRGGTGNAYLYATNTSDGTLLVYLGADNAAAKNKGANGAAPGPVEIELNQNGFGGARSANDLLVRIELSGADPSVEVSRAHADGAWERLASLSGNDCTADNDVCSLANAGAVEGGVWSGGKTIEAGGFVELAINVTALLGDARICYRNVETRTAATVAAKGFYTCKGTVPAIWPERSGYFSGEAVRILGWNLAPDTTYQLIAIPPSGKTVKASPATTDAEGNLPADVARFVAGAKSGIHEVQVHPHPWSASQAGEPVARTAFSVLAD